MKTKILVFLAGFCLFLMLSTTTFAQDEGDKSIGAFLAYGTEIESLGIGVNGEYFFTPAIAIAADFIFFFPNKTDIGSYELKQKLSVLSANCHYHFDAGGSVMPYVLAGLNIGFVKVEIDDPQFGGSASDSEIGLNLGGGADFDIGSSIVPFAELRYATNTEQLEIMGGIRFPLN